jgi:hypothetical protein
MKLWRFILISMNFAVFFTIDLNPSFRFLFSSSISIRFYVLFIWLREDKLYSPVIFFTITAINHARLIVHMSLFVSVLSFSLKCLFVFMSCCLDWRIKLNVLCTGDIREHWRWRYRWWEFTSYPWSDMDNHSSIPDSRYYHRSGECSLVSLNRIGLRRVLLHFFSRRSRCKTNILLIRAHFSVAISYRQRTMKWAKWAIFEGARRRRSSWESLRKKVQNTPLHAVVF